MLILMLGYSIAWKGCGEVTEQNYTARFIIRKDADPGLLPECQFRIYCGEFR
ncbi:hypothetical protein I2I11_06735 [Pontibacter sp. 172403-2]|uniref:hypothetical protein n=1 Tax=Pontibacter rufus TaxID=2791028 RepID=UPI0018AFF700|nr:hypothetical protein [Pontibacter sp. 172403-2]MBF9252981.1 hypothetical protein [Pontibacter sp. 172403-2]